MSTAEWFRRLGDVPGVEYRPLVAVDRTRLPGHDACPEVRTYGDQQFYLDWGSREMRTGDLESLWAPVREHLKGVLDDETTSTSRLVKRLSEGFELPGEPTDYHWKLGSAVETLWKRRAEPDALAAVEPLALAHVQLTLAFPALALYSGEATGGEERYKRPDAFPTLIRLYTAEGFLREALQVAQREAQRFPVDGDDLADIRARLAAVAAESGS